MNNINTKDLEERLYKDIIVFNVEEVQKLRYMVCDALRDVVSDGFKRKNEKVTRDTDLTETLVADAVGEYIERRVHYAYSPTRYTVHNFSNGVYLVKAFESKQLLRSLISNADGLYYFVKTYTDSMDERDIMYEIGQEIGRAYWNADINYIEEVKDIERYFDYTYQSGFAMKGIE